jgi:hypothetical protein
MESILHAPIFNDLAVWTRHQSQSRIKKRLPFGSIPWNGFTWTPTIIFQPKNCACASVAHVLLINSRRHMFPREVYRKLMRKMRSDAIVIKSPNNKNNNGHFKRLFWKPLISSGAWGPLKPTWDPILRPPHGPPKSTLFETQREGIFLLLLSARPKD